MGLKHGVKVSGAVRKLAKDLKEEYNLSDFESLTLALKAERNELFKLAFVISSSDTYPSALEKIAMLLEHK